LIGTTLSHFQITAKLGEGGMGEVYRAEDTKLGREVAIKVLPDSVASDPDRLARFEREAQVLASLNHTNIGGIYQVEQDSFIYFLVLELAEGEDLSRTLQQGPIPVDDAIGIAHQIAAALEAAHERSIVHRDLKPANIKVDHNGRVKVLDFGLAKALDPLGASNESGSRGVDQATVPDFSLSPTMSAGMTRAGMVLGTAPYMAPEQARGKPVDRRIDIWAFGVVFYEMLTGRRLVEGETLTDLLAAIIQLSPDWSQLPADTPDSVRRLLYRCLQLDPNQRLQHIGEARIALKGDDTMPNDLGISGPVPQAEEAEAPSGEPGGKSKLRRFGILIGGLLLGIALATGLAKLNQPKHESRPVRRLDLTFDDVDLTDIARAFRVGSAVSPDGSKVAYLNSNGGLSIRDMESGQSAAIDDTRGAIHPFFSPDSRWVGFTKSFRLYKVAVDGGVPIELGPLNSFPNGAAWSSDGEIFISRFAGDAWVPTIYRFITQGSAGEPIFIAPPPGDPDFISIVAPQLLPGERSILVTSSTGLAFEPTEHTTRIETVSLDDGSRRVVMRGAGWAQYSATGHVIALGPGDKLLAVAFDPETLSVSESPVVVATGVDLPYSLTTEGTLYFTPAHERAQQSNTLWWYDRNASATQLPIEPGFMIDPRLSPDGTRLSVIKAQPDGANIWIYDFERSTFSPLTHGSYLIGYQAWSPDSRTIAFSRGFAGTDDAGIFVVPTDGSAEPERVSTGVLQRVHSWTANGSAVAYSYHGFSTEDSSDLWLQPIEKATQPEILLGTDFQEIHPALSPDGRWLAYFSNQTGRFDLFVRPFPGPGVAVQVTTAEFQGENTRFEGTGIGGTPVWRGDGEELYFYQGSSMMVVRVSGDEAPIVSRPEELFVFDRKVSDIFDVTADGSRFLVIEESAGETITGLKVIQGFDQILEDKVPND
jgi:serine/threonine-protein kinase